MGKIPKTYGTVLSTIELTIELTAILCNFNVHVEVFLEISDILQRFADGPTAGLSLDVQKLQRLGTGRALHPETVFFLFHLGILESLNRPNLEFCG